MNIWWLITTPIVASNFLNRKEILFWAFMATTSTCLFFIPSFNELTFNDVPEEKMAFLKLSSVFALTLVFTTTAYFSEHSRRVANQKERAATDSANRASSMAALGEMAGGIAHEINNPLMIISGSSNVIEKLIEKEDFSKDKVKKHLEKIRNTSKRASKIIKGLKTLSRDGITDPREKTTIEEVLEDVLSFMGSKLNHNEIILHLDRDNPALKRPIAIFRVQFSQVILNLLSNSFDAIVEQASPWISIDIVEVDNTINMRFTDSGSGIPPEVLEKIFTPFFTTKPVGKGTGLGLPLCHSIMEKCGGSLEYESNCPNTCFIVTLSGAALEVDPQQVEEARAS